MVLFWNYVIHSKKPFFEHLLCARKCTGDEGEWSVVVTDK